MTPDEAADYVRQVRVAQPKLSGDLRTRMVAARGGWWEVNGTAPITAWEINQAVRQVETYYRVEGPFSYGDGWSAVAPYMAALITTLKQLQPGT